MSDASFKEKLLVDLREKLSTMKIVRTTEINNVTFQPTINISIKIDLTVELLQDASVAIGEDALYAEIGDAIVFKMRNYNNE